MPRLTTRYALVHTPDSRLVTAAVALSKSANTPLISGTSVSGRGGTLPRSPSQGTSTHV